jgi:hypothetical protein
MHRFAALFLTASCARTEPVTGKSPTGDSAVDEQTTPVEPTGSGCENPLVRVTPEDGEGAVYHLSTVEAELSAPDATARWTVSAGGVDLPGRNTVDGAVVRWDGVLDTDTDYRATLTHACGSNLVLFSTSDIGEPVEVDLAGLTWTLDFAAGTWTEPAGAGGALASLMADFRILLSVPAAPDGGTISLAAGVGVAGHQNACVPTLDLSDSAWSDPYFSAESDAFELATEEFSLTVEDFVTSGAFSPDGTRVAEAAVSGIVDTRGLGAALQVGDGPGAVCELLGTLGASCVPCADGMETCLPMDIENVYGVLSPVPLVDVTVEDVLADPSCD